MRTLGCLRIDYLQTLQRCERHAGRCAGDLTLNCGVASIDLLLLQILLQRFADAHLRLLIQLRQTNATSACFANCAT